MQISFSSELAHSMAVMLLELHAELEEFAYQHDHVSDHGEQLFPPFVGEFRSGLIRIHRQSTQTESDLSCHQ